MGNAAFYFYPRPAGNKLVTIDLGSALGQMYSDFEWQSSTGVTLNGKMQRVNGMTRELITISRDRMAGGEETAHKLLAMQNHLDRGYSVAFTADTDKTWFAPIRKSPVGGDETVEVYANPFHQLFGTQIPSANDYVAIETMGPGMLQEIKKLSNVSSLTSTAGGDFDCNAINFTYEQKLSFARWYRCFVGLKRPQADVGKAIVTNESGILWSLQLTLVPDAFEMFKFHPDLGSEQRIEWQTDSAFNGQSDGRAAFDSVDYNINRGYRFGPFGG